MKFTITDRWTGSAIFEAEIGAEFETASRSVQLGAAVRVAVKAGANLAGANLAGANLAGVNLADVNLARANLAGANLACADLTDANLARANLADAYLAGANLARADLTDANLARANLADANLAGVNLADAYLAGAYLADANLAGAKWRDGIAINRTPLFVGGLLYRVWILDQHMQIGCELHSLADWSDFDDRRIARMDGKTALKFWHAHKDALMALARSDGRGIETKNEAA